MHDAPWLHVKGLLIEVNRFHVFLSGEKLRW